MLHQFQLSQSWKHLYEAGQIAFDARDTLVETLHKNLAAEPPQWWKVRLDVLVGLREMDSAVNEKRKSVGSANGRKTVEDAEIIWSTAPRKTVTLSLRKGGEQIWSTRVATRKWQTGEWLSGSLWHYAEGVIVDHSIVVFHGCDDAVAISKIRLRDGRVVFHHIFQTDDR